MKPRTSLVEVLNLRPNIIEEFDLLVDRSGGPDACWPCTLTPGDGGYPYVSGGRRGLKVLAHRLAHYLATGREPEVVRHSCDNPPCCNPAHLLDGDHASNNQDAVDRGRQAWSRRTHCKNDHEFTPENTLPRTDGGRRCRTRRDEQNARRPGRGLKTCFAP